MSKLIDVDISHIVHETDDAYLVPSLKTLPSDGQYINVWLPKSQCENNEDGTFTMPEWLAIEKDLI